MRNEFLYAQSHQCLSNSDCGEGYRCDLSSGATKGYGVCVSDSNDSICDPDCNFDNDCTAFCNNGEMDGNEDGVDCGGSCVPCQKKLFFETLLSSIGLWANGNYNLSDIFGILSYMMH